MPDIFDYIDYRLYLRDSFTTPFKPQLNHYQLKSDHEPIASYRTESYILPMDYLND
jgi:hypothetical protein